MHTIDRRHFLSAFTAAGYGATLFPGVLWASTVYRSHKPMETFTVSEETRRPPSVKF